MDVFNCCLKNFIRYDRLYALTMREFYGSQANEINLWIDANSAISQAFVYDPALLTYKSYNVFASLLINMAAHYRNYFKTRHHTYATIYIVFGTNNPVYACQEYDGYNAHHVQRYNSNLAMAEVWSKSVEALNLLCPYIPSVYFVDAQRYEVGAVMSEMISRDMTQRPNIIISTDPWMYLVVDGTPNTCCYRPKKSANDDVSYLVNKSTLAQTYTMAINQTPPKDSEGAIFSQSIIYAGMKCREISGVMNYKTSLMINRKPYFFTTEEDKIITRNAKLLSLQWHIACMRANPVYETIFRGIQDLYDPDSVKDINNQFYQDYPLDLNVL